MMPKLLTTNFMEKNLLAAGLILGLLLPTQARADCAFDQTICEARCSIKHFDSNAARLGCESRCAAERAACSTEAGAKKALEMGKDAWDDTGAFVEGFTGDDPDDEKKSEEKSDQESP
ncbi:hypothetical protein [Marinobacterium lutimaris]|uniref:Uncharacterized protein n=1 Tax=Marinobacterium lutimaris TaxID=568106 RepID=A0A1H6AZC1_9GAMM|nr:hypothetical protein [Marinobacterium lutimaris]SEG53395.1 hypothetical protein SAMN05444390_102280 [Marinobacterium lutimaris]